MKNPVSKKDLDRLLRRLRRNGNRIVFTNGVFDVLHRGHVAYLQKAKSFGDILIVGLNSDASTRRLKGSSRPYQKQADRAIILAALEAVNFVVLFGEDTPDKLIRRVKPDVLVKGADYAISEIVGANFVKSYGGKVRRVRLTKGRSSTAILEKIAKE